MAHLRKLINSGLHTIVGALALRGAIGSGSLSGNLTVHPADAYIVTFTPASAARTVTLPTGKDGQFRVYRNAGAFNLLVNNPAGTLLATLSPGSLGVFVCEDGTWSAMWASGFATLTDPGNAGAIPVTATNGQVAIVTAGAETRTLAIPTHAGQRLILSMQTDGGDCVVTVAAAINMTGNTTITLNDASDSIELVGIVGSAGALLWRVVVNNGCTLG